MNSIELSPDAFQCLPALFSRSEHVLVIRSIAAGHTPARAWVDQLEQPSAALVWDRMSGLYLAGKPGLPGFLSDMGRLLRETILPDARQRWIPEMEFFYDGAGWEAGLHTLLAEDFSPSLALFNSYRLADPQRHRELLLPHGFTLARVNRDLLARHDLDHMEHLTGWILSFYRTLNDFLTTGFGYVAIAEQDQAIASLCITVFVAPSQGRPGQDYELGLATAPEYRRRGLAGATAAACVRHSLEEHSTPVWHCWADNTPSAVVAEKVGFALIRQTPAIRFDTKI